jgi:hypothetical protein
MGFSRIQSEDIRLSRRNTQNWRHGASSRIAGVWRRTLARSPSFVASGARTRKRRDSSQREYKTEKNRVNKQYDLLDPVLCLHLRHLASRLGLRPPLCPVPVTFRRSEPYTPTQRSTRSSASATQSAPAFPRPTIRSPDFVRLRVPRAPAADPYLHRSSPPSIPPSTPPFNPAASPLSPALRLASGAPPRSNSLGAASSDRE